ncbi:DUF2487 family protein [Ferviditalea candida]|uniref:DUF2487 family protein n=1 Tax=Ferviditalea candida TaxID=3108399 RepID=A0ABU5ZGF1_9BACL|nr:DUF2487 family protein [Paenibacillaceae bacterium T2]
MKFSEITQTKWQEWKPYMDTCLLPLTGLTGGEQPWEVTRTLEELRDVMDRIEIPYKGRIVTYPTVQYQLEGQAFEAFVNQLCANMISAGFAHVVLVTGNALIREMNFEQADLLIGPEDEPRISEMIQTMWEQK